MTKVALAYSGGLDTSIIIPWLKEHYDNCEVIACCIDLGQDDDFDSIKEKALASGASKVYIEDVKDEFVSDFVLPVLRAGALYENRYLLGTACARPLISKAILRIAQREGAEYIAHGATGKGNDQVRFELAIKALSPDTKMIAPWRLWNIKSREDAVDYAQQHGIPIPVTKQKPYSMDQNVLHLSHEGADLEDPAHEPPADIFLVCKRPEDAPDEAEYVTITFKQGIPVALNGEEMTPLQLLESANQYAAKHGVGIVDMVEDRLVGMKSRGVYETPGGTLLFEAHRLLETLVLDRATMATKHQLSQKYAELVYDGLWFSPLKEAIDAFVDRTQESVTGEVRMKLYKGSCYPAGITSPYSLYHEGYVTFGEDCVYNQADADGFITLFGLPLTVRALMKQSLASRTEEQHHE